MEMPLQASADYMGIQLTVMCDLFVSLFMSPNSRKYVHTKLWEPKAISGCNVHVKPLNVYNGRWKVDE